MDHMPRVEKILWKQEGGGETVTEEAQAVVEGAVYLQLPRIAATAVSDEGEGGGGRRIRIQVPRDKRELEGTKKQNEAAVDAMVEELSELFDSLYAAGVV